MTDIWETRVGAPAVIHGEATLYTAWRLVDNRWQMRGSFWSRTEAEKAVAE